jgi:hypothetical protein
VTAPSARRPRRTRLRRGRRADGGSAAVEFAVGVPAIVGLVMIILQLFLWGIADLQIKSAANAALQTTRVVGGTEYAGSQDAATLMEHNAIHAVVDPQIRVVRTATTTTVTITGHARSIISPRLIPGLQPTVTITITGPNEVFNR